MSRWHSDIFCAQVVIIHSDAHVAKLMIKKLGQREAVPKLSRHAELLIDMGVVIVTTGAANNVRDFPALVFPHKKLESVDVA